MQPAKAVKSAAKLGWDSFEDFGNEMAGQLKPMWEGLPQQFGFGSVRKTEMAQEDLKRAREEKKLEEMKKEEDQKSKDWYNTVQKQYTAAEQKQSNEQGKLQQEMAELTSEVVKLAKSAGIDTKVHLEQAPKRIGILDIKRLTSIIRYMRIKADAAKSGNELVNQRSNAKRSTGMLAWVSGKQMKVHEQGTLQLQG